MDKIKNLQVKRMLKELEYVESDFEYRTELISEADNQFIKSINDFLHQHPDIKEVYDKKINERIQKTIEKKIEDSQKTEQNDEVFDAKVESTDDETPSKIDIDETNPKIKKIYREIVKLTHPDIVDKRKLNDLYIVATKCYDSDDKIGLYKVCDELNIDYEIEDDDEVLISDKITGLKKRIDFLESTYTWQWHNAKNDMEKNQILVNYIKLRLS